MSEAGDRPEAMSPSRCGPAESASRLGPTFAFHEPSAHRGRHLRRIGVTAAMLAVLALGGGHRALATAFVVNDTRALVDASAGNGECRTSAGPRPPRGALQETNALSRA